MTLKQTTRFSGLKIIPSPEDDELKIRANTAPQTTVERDATPTDDLHAGLFIFNTTTNQVEFYIGNSWGTV